MTARRSKFFDELVEARRNPPTDDLSPAPEAPAPRDSTVNGSLTLFEGGAVYLCGDCFSLVPGDYAANHAARHLDLGF